MGRLDGKCAVKIFEANSTANPPYYVMEFVRWGDFRSVLHRRISVSRLLSMLQSICECVAECHVLDITHRDIKPGNILFRSPNNPISADFGICKLGATALDTIRMEMESAVLRCTWRQSSSATICPRASRQMFTRRALCSIST